jgi:hypothetical protein
LAAAAVAGDRDSCRNRRTSSASDYYADAVGQPFDGPIAPDQAVDDRMTAALAWLKEAGS